jgi:hypothetical protein
VSDLIENFLKWVVVRVVPEMKKRQDVKAMEVVAVAVVTG